MANKGARQVALEILYGIETKGSYANLALGQHLEKEHLDGSERRLVSELVYGTLKNRELLDWTLTQYLNSKIETLTPWIRNILRLGAYQVLFLDRIPVSAACNESVKLAKIFGHIGTARLVNAVLRKFIQKHSEISLPNATSDPIQYLTVRYSHPRWLIERWLKLFGFLETEALCAANNTTPAMTIRVNTLRTNLPLLESKLLKQGLQVQRSTIVPEGLRVDGFDRIEQIPGFSEGEFIIQDETSILIGHLVSPKPGQQVLDTCAAPGGKATHLAQLMNNSGKILANDVHESRIKLIRENCLRLGTSIIEISSLDARNLPQTLADSMDVVLVDAPCSGTGVLRRKPDARWRKQPKDWDSLLALQAQILDSAAKCVRPGGILVYSTCSIDPSENQLMVHQFLQRQSNYSLVSLLDCLPSGFAEWPDLKETATQGWMQLYPHRHGTDGFYGARMRRSAL